MPRGKAQDWIAIREDQWQALLRAAATLSEAYSAVGRCCLPTHYFTDLRDAVVPFRDYSRGEVKEG